MLGGLYPLGLSWINSVRGISAAISLAIDNKDSLLSSHSVRGNVSKTAVGHLEESSSGLSICLRICHGNHVGRLKG